MIQTAHKIEGVFVKEYKHERGTPWGWRILCTICEKEVYMTKKGYRHSPKRNKNATV